MNNLETLLASNSYLCLKSKHLQGSIMHLLRYNRNWSTQPQIYCNDRVPPLVWLHSCLPDVTWHHCMWWDLPHLFPLYMQVHCGCVWSLYTSPGWEILPHERQQCLPRKRRGVENPCTFLMGKSPNPSSKWLQDDGKLKLMACIHSFPDKIVSTKCLIFADFNLCKFLLSHQIAVLFYWTLGDTHEQVDKKIVPYS